MFNSPKGYHRQLLVGADARASNGFDLGFDAPLIETNKEDMFWVFKNNEFVIQAVNNFDEEQKLPLGMRISQAGISKVKIDDLENMPNNAKIYLNDKELGVYHPITESAYEVYLEPGDYLDRFEITFKSSGTLTVDDVTAQENIQVYFSNQSESIIVHNPVLREIKSVELVNLLGQSIHKFDGTTQNYVEYKTNQIGAGVYIIKVQTPEGSFSKKVLIK